MATRNLLEHAHQLRGNITPSAHSKSAGVVGAERGSLASLFEDSFILQSHVHLCMRL